MALKEIVKQELEQLNTATIIGLDLNNKIVGYETINSMDEYENTLNKLFNIGAREIFFKPMFF